MMYRKLMVPEYISYEFLEHMLSEENIKSCKVLKETGFGNSSAFCLSLGRVGIKEYNTARSKIYLLCWAIQCESCICQLKHIEILREYSNTKEFIAKAL